MGDQGTTDAAKQVRKDASNAIDAFKVSATTGAFAEISAALREAGWPASKTERLVAHYNAALQRASSASEVLYDAAGDLVDACADINRALKARNIPPIV